jgi:hypothetical protein
MKENIIIEHLKLEIGENDFPKEMIYEDFISECSNLGEGWRPPSKIELVSIYDELHLKKLGNFKNSYYWSGEPIIDGKVVCFNFNKGKFYSLKLNSVTQYPNPFTDVNFDPGYFYKYIHPLINRKSTLSCYGRAVRTIISI